VLFYIVEAPGSNILGGGFFHVTQR
jgi:hypothetical protein